MEDGTVNAISGSSGFSYNRSHIVSDAPSSRSSRSPFLRLDYKRQEAALHGTRRADKSMDYAGRAPTYRE